MYAYHLECGARGGGAEGFRKMVLRICVIKYLSSFLLIVVSHWPEPRNFVHNLIKKESENGKKTLFGDP